MRCSKKRFVLVVDFKILLTLNILTLFIVTSVYAQDVNYKFKTISTKQGLSQSTVIAIHQDYLGQMWIGTRDGLNKYDGTKFTVYRNENKDSTSISNNDILAIQEDDSHYLWIGTYNGLNRYNPKTGKFKRYFHKEAKNSLLNNTVWSIKKMTSGKVWVGTAGGLSIYNQQTDRFKNYLTEHTKPARQRVMAILETKKGQVYVGTGAGIFQVERNKQDLVFNLIKGSENFYVQDLVETEDNNLLIATQSQGLVTYNITKEKFNNFFIKNAEYNKIKNIRRLVYDNDNTLWIGTYEGLIVVTKNNYITLLKHELNNNMSLRKNSIKCLFKDKKGSVWIGAYYGGVSIWDPSNVNFQNITQNQVGFGLNYTVVSSIASYQDFMFFGTEGGGLNIWNKKTNSYKYKTKSNSLLKDNNIKELKLINNDKLFVGTFKNGLQVYDLEKQKFINSIFSKQFEETLKNVGVYAISLDKNKNLWIGTFGRGLFKYSFKTGDYKHFQDFENGGSLCNNLIRTIYVDTKNNVWVGTEKGLNKITPKGEIKNYFFDKSLQYGDDILSVYQDSRHNIWVGTKSRGLFKLKEKTFEAVPLVADKAKVSAVRSMLESNEYLWIATNQGIIKFDLNTNAIVVYNQSDGVISNEFNDNACLKVGQSQFFFGGPAGVTYINTTKITTNKYSPQVILTGLDVKENGTSNKITKNTLAYTKVVNLSHTQGNFNISFSIPSFINANNNKYKYRLTGLEKEWNLTSNNTASYTIQKPGNYVFEVLGANNDNVWNKKATTLKIYVAPAPWRTWWAFVIYGLLILSSLYFLLSILKSKTRLKHELELEHLENERTKEINKTKLEFFTNISHEFRTPLALILGPLNQVIEEYRGSSKLYKKLLVIENSANHLLQLINRLMDFRKFENKLFNLEAAEGNIVKFLKEIYLSFTEHAKKDNYHFYFECSEEEILVYYDRNKLERVFYNLISNAFRYTPKGGTITVRVEKNERDVVIKVEDTGVGIAKEYQDKIFERFFEIAVNNKPDNNYNKGTGIGLSIAKNIVELHKGTIAVTSNKEGVGSIFSVTLKLGNNHLSETEIYKNYKFSDDLSQYINQLEDTNVVFEDDLESNTNTNNSTILLVEDNKPLRKFIKSVLKEEYRIIEAENGKVAFNKAIRELPDLIVTDVIMPEMTGVELCSAIKSELKTSHIPVILLTSRSSLIYKLDGLERGADDYISKPFNVKEFKLRIKNLLQTRDKLKNKFVSSQGLLPEEVLVSSCDETLYKKALKIVKENIGNEQFDIAMFCSELGVSRTMLFTKIKAWSNFTPNEFILHFRMKRATQYLEQGKLNISQISYKVGFKNPKYFSKTFQKTFGKTPTQYASKFSNR
ncbi:hybrid sensor histidine kinase/response regulator [Seonamhaeicola sp. S2-3]|nr:hybrid sensor histidine kinase/response regulator [Seonamhaeicola sp. S2-3]